MTYMRKKTERERKRDRQMETHVEGFGGAVPGTGDAVYDVRIPNCNIA